MFFMIISFLNLYKLWICTLFILGSVFCENDTSYNYCSHPDCSMKNQHTLCAARNKQSPRLFASGITAWMRYQILLLHNRNRDNIAMGLEAGQPPAANMRKMYWDYELEEMAEIWARQCQKRHDECRNTVRFNVLQNMDVRPVVPRVTEAQILTDAVGAWFSGSRTLSADQVWSFKFSSCNAPGGCNAHWYSAATWASTWRIGCSQALCTRNKRSCVKYRKKRTLRNTTSFSNVPLTQSSTENILRRKKYFSTPIQMESRIEDTSPTTIKNDRAFLLHRGISNITDQEETTDMPEIFAYTFCNYGPAGNIEGFPIYEMGVTCNNCPQGTSCGDRTHRGLCSVLGDPDIKTLEKNNFD